MNNTNEKKKNISKSKQNVSSKLNKNKSNILKPEMVSKKVSKSDSRIVSNIVHNKDKGNSEFQEDYQKDKIQNKDVSKLEKRFKTAEKNFSKSKNYAKKIKLNNLIYNIIICISLILIIYSSYNIFLWHIDNKKNKKLIDDVTSSTPISDVQEVSINDNLKIEKNSYDFQNLLLQNPDTVGWITVPNTEINYPVVKGENNEYYLKRSFDKEYNAAGWIYADYRNKCDDTDQNLIIYGHNRLNNNMFGTLENVLKDSWIADETNHFIKYSSLNKSSLYEIFSTFICKSSNSTDYLTTDFASKEDYRKYIDNIKNKSSHYFDVRVTEDDQILTLYTCHGLNDERLLVFGKLLKEN